MNQVDFLFLVIMMGMFICIATLLIAINLIFKMNHMYDKLNSLEKKIEKINKNKRKRKLTKSSNR